MLCASQPFSCFGVNQCLSKPGAELLARRARVEFDAAAKLFTRYKTGVISTTIHSDDDMYNNGRAHYYQVGESAIRSILSGLTLSWRQRVDRVLDLPCGYGRVGRHLVAAFPDADRFFCDIEKGGVDFCAEQFGGVGIYSEPDLTAVQLPQDLDVIWVGSLFTHVDLSRTTTWLSYLAEHLREHGVIVATFHGLFTRNHTKNPAGHVDWNQIVADFDATGYGYGRYKTIDMGDYGTSISKPSKIVEVTLSIPGTRLLAYTERGWANNHDVLVLTKNDRTRLLRG